jgi:hypothetical protein
MIGPRFERGLDFIPEFESLVNSLHLRSDTMADCALNYVRRDPECCTSAPQVVNRPGRHARRSRVVHNLLCPCSVEYRSMATEDVTSIRPWLTVKDRAHQRSDQYRARDARLGSGCRQLNFITDNFGPFKLIDFGSAAARERQQLNGRTIARVAPRSLVSSAQVACFPDSDKFGVGQHAVALDRSVWLFHASGRRRLDKIALDAPRQEGTDLVATHVSGSRAALLSVVNECPHVRPCDGLQWSAAPCLTHASQFASGGSLRFGPEFGQASFDIDCHGRFNRSGYSGRCLPDIGRTAQKALCRLAFRRVLLDVRNMG